MTEIFKLHGGALVGREQKLWQLGEFITTESSPPGVVLVGPSGIGKSALARALLVRLQERGWIAASVAGSFSLSEVSWAVGESLRMAATPVAEEACRLTLPTLSDRERVAGLGRLLSSQRIALLFDSMDAQLASGSGSGSGSTGERTGDGASQRLRNPITANWLRELAEKCETGRLLFTSRHPLATDLPTLETVEIEPLSSQHALELAMRLPALSATPEELVRELLEPLRGSPRAIVLLDGLLRERSAEELLNLLRELPAPTLDPLDPDASKASKTPGFSVNSERYPLGGGPPPEEPWEVLFDEFLEDARRRDHLDVLVQLAACASPNRLVPLRELCRTLHGADHSENDLAKCSDALHEGVATGVLHCSEEPGEGHGLEPCMVEAIARRIDPASYQLSCRRAGELRVRLLQQSATQSLLDLFEAARSYLEGGAFDEGSSYAIAAFDALRGSEQLIDAESFAAETLESLPPQNPSYLPLAREHAQLCRTLNAPTRALVSCRGLISLAEARSAKAPERIDHRRELAELYEQTAEIEQLLENGHAALELWEKGLALRAELLSGAVEQTRYRRDLAATYTSLGVLRRTLGESEEARRMLESAAGHWEVLLEQDAESGEARRGLSGALQELGELLQAAGEQESARSALRRADEIRQSLVESPPETDATDRDLSEFFIRLGSMI